MENKYLEMFLSIKDTDDDELINKIYDAIIIGNLNIANKITQKVSRVLNDIMGLGIELEDINQIAYEGLIIAVRNFDISKSNSLDFYLRKSILRFTIQSMYIYSCFNKEDFNKVIYTIIRLSDENKEVNTNNIIDFLVENHWIKSNDIDKFFRGISMDFYHNPYNNNVTSPTDLSLDEIIIEKDMIDRLKKDLSNLPDKSAKIMKYMYGVDDGEYHNTVETARHLNYSPQYVSLVKIDRVNILKRKYRAIENRQI